MVKSIKTGYWDRGWRYRDYDHPIIKAFTEPKLNVIKNAIPADCHGNMSILDVGCGNGIFTYSLSKLGNVSGIDLSRKMLSRNPIRNLVEATSEKLPFENNSFDLVFEANLLHHVLSPSRTIKEMNRVSKQFIALIEPNCINPMMFFFSLLVKDERNGLKFNVKRLKNLFKKEGLHTIFCYATGMISQNNTPTFLVPFLKQFDRKFFCGEYTIALAKKY